jgi:hypothetical protein
MNIKITNKDFIYKYSKRKSKAHSHHGKGTSSKMGHTGKK